MKRENALVFGPRKTHAEVIAENLVLPGSNILDVGCGAGRMARLLTGLGAKVTGLDPGEALLERARMVEPEGDETYVEGVGEDLPFDPESFDIAFFFNSLHHIPGASLGQALEEARRVLKAGGTLFIAEPLPAGPFFEMQRPFHDETEFRAIAQAAVDRLAGSGFGRRRRIAYHNDVVFESFTSFRAGSIAIDAEWGNLNKEQVAELRDRFRRFGKARDDGHYFDQPMQVDLFVKT